MNMQSNTAFAGGWKSKVCEQLKGFMAEDGLDANTEFSVLKSPFEVFYRHAEYACTRDMVDASIRSFKECLRINPDSYLPNYALARVFMTRGEYHKAEKYIDRTIRMRPDIFKVKFTWYFIALKTGKSASEVFAVKNDIVNHLSKTALDHGCGDVVEKVDQLLDEDSSWVAPYRSELKSEFQNKRYVKIQNILPDECLRLILNEQRAAVLSSNMVHEKSKNRLVAVDLLTSATLANYRICSLIGKIVGREVVPTYTFSIHYYEHGYIKPHKDRHQNEISMSVSLDITPESTEWPLYSGDEPDEQTHLLTPNDAFLYRGAEITHFRKPLVDGASCNQLILGFRTISKRHCYST